jgi:asparagine synthase (glutamine-hydrolysing)
MKKAAERIVPKENLYRPKMGFSIPLKQWFSGKIGKYAASILLSKKALDRGIFEEEVLRSLLRTHGGKEDYGAKLWSLLTLELWLESYFD